MAFFAMAVEPSTLTGITLVGVLIVTLLSLTIYADNKIKRKS